MSKMKSLFNYNFIPIYIYLYIYIYISGEIPDRQLEANGVRNVGIRFILFVYMKAGLGHLN